MQIKDQDALTVVAQRPTERATIGLIVPPALGLVPPDAATVYPGVNFLAEGLGLTEMSEHGYDSVIEHVGRVAKRLGEAGAQTIALMGTSLSFYRGPEFNRQIELEMQAQSGMPALTMTTALLTALERLGVTRVAVATAYQDDVNRALKAYLSASGIEVASLASLNIVSIDEVHAVPDGEVTRIGRHAYREARSAEAIVISCGGLPTRQAVRQLEAETGRPVVTSALAGLWATLLTAGIDPRVENEGRLLALGPKQTA